jgi:hypothetical protein
VIAEARFLRAYYQFELVKWFGEPMKEMLDLLGRQKIPRSSVSRCVAFDSARLNLCFSNLSVLPAQKEEQQECSSSIIRKRSLFIA